LTFSLRGEVSIVDHVYKPGHRYAYHRERNDTANEVIRTMLDDPQCSLVVQQKEAEHANMVKLSRNPGWMRQYLDAAPDGFSYDALARLIRT
jgi:hypothetical protein